MRQSWLFRKDQWGHLSGLTVIATHLRGIHFNYINQCTCDQLNYCKPETKPKANKLNCLLGAHHPEAKANSIAIVWGNYKLTSTPK